MKREILAENEGKAGKEEEHRPLTMRPRRHRLRFAEAINDHDRERDKDRGRD
jgi:hypothetical protein